MTVTVDEPGHYQLTSATMTDRIGRPLVCARVQINKSYVSYHLMPVYANKALRDTLSASLGYLKLENLVVRLHFPFVDVPARHPAFVERSAIETTRRRPIGPPPAKSAAPVIQSPVSETLIAHERPPSPAVEQQPFFQ